MIARNNEEISGLRTIGRIVRKVLDEMEGAVAVGISTAELDELAGQIFGREKARSAPKLAYDFPGFTCISVNDEAAHGIPGSRRLKNGDLVNIDVSAEKNGFWADSGRSIPVGDVTVDARDLCRATRNALWAGIRAVKAGEPINVIGKEVERTAVAEGYEIINGLVGHGVGRHIHEPPEVHNLFMPNHTDLLAEGQVITIEPFLTSGRGDYKKANDGWTLKTIDGALCAQYEHTLIVTGQGPIVLT